MYGQSEATARMSYLPPDFLLSKPGSVGIAIPNGKFWLEDDNGQKISSPYTTGNLIYSGSNVSMGYARSWRDFSVGFSSLTTLVSEFSSSVRRSNCSCNWTSL